MAVNNLKIAFSNVISRVGATKYHFKAKLPSQQHTPVLKRLKSQKMVLIGLYFVTVYSGMCEHDCLRKSIHCTKTTNKICQQLVHLQSGNMQTCSHGANMFSSEGILLNSEFWDDVSAVNEPFAISIFILFYETESGSTDGSYEAPQWLAPNKKLVLYLENWSLQRQK